MSAPLVRGGQVIVIARTWRRSTAESIAAQLNALVVPATPYRIQREWLRWFVVVDYVPHGVLFALATVQPKGVSPNAPSNR